MSKEKVTRLNKYLEHVKEKLSTIPAKHVGSERTYLEFWNKELKTTTSKIEALQLQLK